MHAKAFFKDGSIEHPMEKALERLFHNFTDPTIGTDGSARQLGRPDLIDETEKVFN